MVRHLLPHPRRRLLPVLILVWLAAGGMASRGAGLGQEVNTGAGPQPDLLPAVAGEDPAWLSHVVLSREAQAGGGGIPAPLMRGLRASGHQVLVTLEPGEVVGDPSAWADAWADELIDTMAGLDPAVVAVAPALPAGVRGAAVDAYIFKQAAVALRAARPGIRVVLELRGGSVDTAWLTALHEEEIATYVDAWAWRLASGQAPPSVAEVRELGARRLALDPASPLWILGLPAGAGGTAPTALAGALLSAGATQLTFRVGDPAGREELIHLRHALPAAAGPTGGPPPRIRNLDGAEVDSIAAWSFFAPEQARALVILAPAAGAPTRIQVELPTFDVTEPEVIDPRSGGRQDLAGGIPDRRRNRTLVTVEDLDGPRILGFRRFATPGAERAQVAVDTSREPTVEEILARHQEVAALAADRVHSVSADARVMFHYTVAGSGATIDVAYDSRYFWDEAVGAEFEYLTMYFNGARWRRGKFPDVPLIQPEKVVTPPLRIAMGKQYVYRLEGRDQVEDRPAWRVAFAPRDAAATRYRGTAWIDRETYRLLKQDVVQTGLEAPVVSSEETNRYGAYPIPGGGEASLPTTTRGQQQWSVGGVRFVVFREVFFANVRINEPEFENRRQEAYASDHQMLRETDEGLRYLVPDEQGGRTVRDGVRTRSLFLLGGGFYNEAVDSAIPFVGFDYFNYDIKQSGQQVNFFLAGAANFLTWADPAVAGTRLEMSSNLALIGFASADRYFVDGDERPEAEVKTRSQALSAALGVPIGQFMKFRGRLGLIYENYQAGQDMDPDFIVPSDTLIPSVTLEYQFNRKGFSIIGEVAGFRRQDWEPWGDPDPASDLVGSRLDEFDPGQRSYTRWAADVSQDLFFRSFQKFRFSATWLDGDNLDRFSRYQFSFFGQQLRLSGFSGSGMRFDRGILGRLRYSFNLGEVLTFEAGLDQARVEYLPDGGGARNFTGVGLAAKFMGPWGLLVRLEYGYALRSDIPAVEGEQEGQLLFLKIF